MAVIVNRNICAENRLEAPGTKWTTSPKMIENNRAKIPSEFRIQTAKMVAANQHEKLDKYKGLKEEL